MWASIPESAQEYIYEQDLPLKIAHIDEDFDLPDEEVRVAGIAQRDGGTLYIQSQKKHRNWEFPGGRLNDDETPYDAILREFTEETGYDVLEATPLLALVWAFKSSTIVQLVFSIDVGEEISDPDPDEVQEVAWKTTVHEEVSFGDVGQETYEVIIESTPVDVSFTDGAFFETHKRTLALGGVVGSALAASLARRLLSQDD